MENGDRIIVSVSGGSDSVCLLRVLNSFQNKIDFDLHVVHFNHGLRSESEEEEEFVRKLTDKCNANFSAIRTNELKNEKHMQVKAREWRIENLKQIMKDLSFNKIGVGHHLDDLVETQIWRLTRGASLFSLAPILAKNLPFIRPLLNTSKESLKQYLVEIGQDWREDKSNFSDDYTRNLIRNKVIPLLNQCAGEKLNDKFLGIYHDAVRFTDYFDHLFPPECYEKNEIDYDELNSLNPLFAHEIIHRYLLFHDQTEINRQNIEKIFDLIMSGRGNWEIQLKNNTKLIGRNKKISLFQS